MGAHVETVDGVRLPARLSGHPVLDFCNTWTGWDGNAPADFLRTYDDLLVWSRFVGLQTPAETAALSARAGRAKAATLTATLNRARRLRAGLYEVLTSKEAGPHWSAVAEEVGVALAAAVPEPATVGLRWRTATAPGLTAPITAVALSALELLGSSAIDQVNACPGDGCGWLFLDRSGRRRWCSMAVCGNRAKVRRFAQRTRD